MITTWQNTHSSEILLLVIDSKEATTEVVKRAVHKELSDQLCITRMLTQRGVTCMLEPIIPRLYDYCWVLIHEAQIH